MYYTDRPTRQLPGRLRLVPPPLPMPMPLLLPPLSPLPATAAAVVVSREPVRVKRRVGLSFEGVVDRGVGGGVSGERASVGGEAVGGPGDAHVLGAVVVLLLLVLLVVPLMMMVVCMVAFLALLKLLLLVLLLPLFFLEGPLRLVMLLLLLKISGALVGQRREGQRLGCRRL
jgi:hypothetical protein